MPDFLLAAGPWLAVCVCVAGRLPACSDVLTCRPGLAVHLASSGHFGLMLPPLRFVREDALRRPDHVKCLSGPWQAALVRVDKLEELLCPLADLHGRRASRHPDGSAQVGHPVAGGRVDGLLRRGDRWRLRLRWRRR